MVRTHIVSKVGDVSNWIKSQVLNLFNFRLSEPMRERIRIGGLAAAHEVVGEILVDVDGGGDGAAPAVGDPVPAPDAAPVVAAPVADPVAAPAPAEDHVAVPLVVAPVTGVLRKRALDKCRTKHWSHYDKIAKAEIGTGDDTAVRARVRQLTLDAFKALPEHEKRAIGLDFKPVPIPRPLNKRPSGARRRRLAQLQKEIVESAGLEASVDDQATMFDSILPAEVRSVLEAKYAANYQKSKALESADTFWADFGPKLREAVESWQQGNRHLGDSLLASVARSAGVSREDFNRLAGAAVSSSLWTSAPEAPDDILVPHRHDNGRTGKRTIPGERLLNVFQDNSAETCTFLVDPTKVKAKAGPVAGEKRKRATEVADLAPRFSLQDSCKGIWAGCNEPIGYSTLTKRRRTEFWQFRQAGSMRVDSCDLCWQWDHKVYPTVKAAVESLFAALETARPGYWATFAHHGEEITRFNLTPAYVESLLAYVQASGCANFKKKGRLTKAVAALHKAETEALTQLRKSMPHLPGGIVPTVQVNYWHFTARDACKDSGDRIWANPEPGWTYCRCDFLENPRLPITADQAGSFWYAGSVLALTCLVFTFWGVGMKTTYVTVFSRVLEKTPRYVIAAFNHIFKSATVQTRLKEEGKGFHLVVDVGTHFRTYPIVEHFLMHIPEKYDLEGAISSEVEHHGKCSCDGEGGRMKTEMKMAAKRMMAGEKVPGRKIVIGDEHELVTVLRAADKRAKLLNPSAPATKYIVFTPPQKTTIRCRTLDAKTKRELLITRTYHLTGTARTVKRKGESIVHHTLRNHVFPGHPAKDTWAPTSVDYVEAAKADDETDDGEAEDKDAPTPVVKEINGWRCSYRTREPEKADPQFALLKKRYDSQKSVGLAFSSRHRTFAQRAGAKIRTKAQQKTRSAGLLRLPLGIVAG